MRSTWPSPARSSCGDDPQPVLAPVRSASTTAPANASAWISRSSAARAGPPPRRCGPGRRSCGTGAVISRNSTAPSLVTTSSRRRRSVRRAARARRGSGTPCRRPPTDRGVPPASAASTTQASLVSGSRSRPRSSVPAAGQPEVQLEALVGLVEHQHVVGGVGADPVPPDLARPVGLVVHGVEEPQRVGAPGSAVVAAGDLVGQVLPGAQVAEAQLEDLVAGGVDAVGEQVLVGADQGQADVEVAGSEILLRDVEEHR